MDALIRAAQLAPFRMRLSESRLPAAVAVHPAAAAESPRQQHLAALRDEIEKQVRAEMSANLQQLHEAERARARAAGLEDARQVAAEEVTSVRAELRAQLDASLAALERAHADVLARIESSVGEVAFAAVCRFVGHKAASVEFVTGLVGEACAQLRAETTATARLHPRDVELLSDELEGRLLRMQSVGLTLVRDESLSLGGCVVETSAGRFDGGLESQLRRLHAVLTAGSR